MYWPVWSQPSSSITVRVFSGSLKYPKKTLEPRTQISPWKVNANFFAFHDIISCIKTATINIIFLCFIIKLQWGENLWDLKWRGSRPISSINKNDWVLWKPQFSPGFDLGESNGTCPMLAKYSSSGTSQSLIAEQAIGGPTCSVVASP